MAYEFDSKLRGPEELGDGADWHIDYIERSGFREAHAVCVQFGSSGIDRDEAEIIAARILAGLNSGR